MTVTNGFANTAREVAHARYMVQFNRLLADDSIAHYDDIAVAEGFLAIANRYQAKLDKIEKAPKHDH